MWIDDIPENYWYINSFQKWIYKLYKTWGLNYEWIKRLLDTHKQLGIMLINNKTTKEKYLEGCWLITDRLNEESKKIRDEWGNNEFKKEIGKLYGFITNRYRE